MAESKHKIAVVAGVNNDAGRAAVTSLDYAGWKVVGMDAASKSELPTMTGLHDYVALDLTDRNGVAQAIRKIEAEAGPVELLFAATGFEQNRQCAGFLETPIAQWKNALNGWLSSSINACYAAAPGMVQRKSGRILLFCPDYSKLNGDHILDAAASATLHGFSKSFGVEMAPHNVLVNCLFANLPIDQDAIGAMTHFLADSGNYVSAQVISIHGIDGKDEEVKS